MDIMSATLILSLFVIHRPSGREMKDLGGRRERKKEGENEREKERGRERKRES